MAQFHREFAATLPPLWTNNGPAIVESLNQCFDAAWTLSVDPECPFSPAELGYDATAEGLLISLTAENQHLLLAIPKSLPLPDWIATPNMSQSSRLETLAMEWSLNCLPEELPCDQFASAYVRSLIDAIEGCGLKEGATLVRLRLEGPVGTVSIFGVIGVERAPIPETPEEPDLSETAGDSREPTEAAYPPGDASAMDSTRGDRVRRLLKLPVGVIVKLAEKRIPLGQFLALCPGSILTFEKSCEDLLDLHINNSLYARGEAVKIGEKFGLKVNEVGSVKHRVSAILHPHR
jgi:flagellar motor switch protein FliN